MNKDYRPFLSSNKQTNRQTDRQTQPGAFIRPRGFRLRYGTTFRAFALLIYIISVSEYDYIFFDEVLFRSRN